MIVLTDTTAALSSCLFPCNGSLINQEDLKSCQHSDKETTAIVPQYCPLFWKGLSSNHHNVCIGVSRTFGQNMMRSVVTIFKERF